MINMVYSLIFSQAQFSIAELLDIFLKNCIFI